MSTCLENGNDPVNPTPPVVAPSSAPARPKLRARLAQLFEHAAELALRHDSAKLSLQALYLRSACDPTRPGSFSLRAQCCADLGRELLAAAAVCLLKSAGAQEKEPWAGFAHADLAHDLVRAGAMASHLAKACAKRDMQRWEREYALKAGGL